MGCPYLIAMVVAFSLTGANPVHAATNKHLVKGDPSRQEAPGIRDTEGVAEARLIEVYKLIGKGKNREALTKATLLVKDLPNFQLAQLVYGDL